MTGSSAGTTAVSLSPADAEAQPGQTVTFDVVVDAADGGVGAHSLTIELGDETVGTVTGVAVLDNPQYETVDISAEGGTATVTAAVTDTSETGTVTIVRVDVDVLDTGTTSVDLAVETLADDVGRTYTISDAVGAILSTPGALSLSLTGDSIAQDGTASLDVDASSIEGLTVRKLWTDWTVTAADSGGGTTTDNVQSAGTFGITWSAVQESTTPTIAVEPPSRYVGGTYVVEATATDGVDEVSDTATIQIG